MPYLTKCIRCDSKDQCNEVMVVHCMLSLDTCVLNATPSQNVSWTQSTTAEYSMTRQDMMRGWRMPRHDQPMKDADQQRYDGGAAVRP